MRVFDGQPEKMTKNENRRRLVLGLLAASLAVVLPVGAAANPLSGLQRWGSGEFRRFGFLVYEATLWAADDPQRPPLALKLTYRRNIAGEAITAASIKEIRALGLTDEATLQRWGETMGRLFPDVRPGDAITGHYTPSGATFYFNDRAIGEVADAAFARAFFAIWLDPRTSAPELRAALLKRGAAS